MEARGVPVDVVFADASSSGGSLNVDIDDKGSSSVGNSDSRDNGTAAEVETKKRPRERLWATALAALVAAVPALLVGYTIGFPSSALLDLTGDPAAGIPSDYVFSSTLADVFAVNQSTFTFDLEDFYDFFMQALAPVGGVFGGLIAGPIADRWGRKNALVLCGIPYFVGYLVLSYAHYLPTAESFKTIVLLGRFLTGVGMGWACMSASVSSNYTVYSRAPNEGLHCMLYWEKLFNLLPRREGFQFMKLIVEYS